MNPLFSEDQDQSQLILDKRNLYRQKLNQLFEKETREDMLSNFEVTGNNLEHGKSCHNFYQARNQPESRGTKGSMLGESISKRRMKLKGGSTTKNSHIIDIPKHTTQSSVFDNENNFGLLITNESDRNSYIAKRIKYANDCKLRASQVMDNQNSYFFKNFQSINTEVEVKEKKPSVNRGFLKSLDKCLAYFDKSISQKDSPGKSRIERLDSIVSLKSNSVKFYTPNPGNHNQMQLNVRENEPRDLKLKYKDFETITSDVEESGMRRNSSMKSINLKVQNNELIKQNLMTMEENKSLQEMVSIITNEQNTYKKHYKKLKGKFKILKESNIIVAKKLENERNSHNESRQFLKRLLQVKNVDGNNSNENLYRNSVKVNYEKKLNSVKEIPEDLNTLESKVKRGFNKRIESCGILSEKLSLQKKFKHPSNNLNIHNPLNISSSKVSSKSIRTSRGSSQIRENSYSIANSKENNSGLIDEKSPKFVIDDNSVDKIKKARGAKLSIHSRNNSSRNIYGSCNYRQRESSKKSDFKHLSKGNYNVQSFAVLKNNYPRSSCRVKSTSPNNDDPNPSSKRIKQNVEQTNKSYLSRNCSMSKLNGIGSTSKKQSANKNNQLQYINTKNRTDNSSRQKPDNTKKNQSKENKKPNMNLLLNFQKFKTTNKLSHRQHNKQN